MKLDNGHRFQSTPYPHSEKWGKSEPATELLKLVATPAAVETECRIDGPLSDHD